MLGSEFVQAYSRKPLPTWEQATLDLARQGSLAPWPSVDITLVDGADTAVLSVQSDVLAIGTIADHVRMPLTTPYAQSVANLFGALLPTPWLEYAIWKSAPAKLAPHAMSTNLYGNLEQYAAHSRFIDEQLIAQSIPPGTLVAGIKKGVVVANFYKAGKVLLFGWYRPSPPFPDVFDDGQPMESPTRQPIQPKSNVHAEGYVDYSQVIRLISPICTVNGQPMETAALYQHPTLYRLVNPDVANPPGQRGPIRTPRYPAPVPPLHVQVPPGPVPSLGPAATDVVYRPSPQGRVPFTPDPTEIALDAIAHQKSRKT